MIPFCSKFDSHSFLRCLRTKWDIGVFQQPARGASAGRRCAMPAARSARQGGSCGAETVVRKVLMRPIPAQGGSKWSKRRLGRRPMVAQAAPAPGAARGPQRPAHPARRCRLILALAHHRAILTRPPHAVHRTMVQGIRPCTRAPQLTGSRPKRWAESGSGVPPRSIARCNRGPWQNAQSQTIRARS